MKLPGFNQKSLQIALGGFLLALLIPTLMLVFQAYQQLERDTFFQYRTAAEELARRIDEQLAAALLIEDQREFSDYSFLVVAGQDFVQRSPLSDFPVVSSIAGARSYFQVDADGNLTTPLIPPRQSDGATFGVSSDEYSQRLGLQNQILELLTQSLPAQEEKEQDLDSQASTDLDYRRDKRMNAQRVLDRLEESSQTKTVSNLGRVADLKLNDSAAQMPEPMVKLNKQRPRRLEKNVAPARSQPELQTPATVSLETFTSEVEPFRFTILDAENFVLYRTVWRDKARHIQGLVFARDEFLQASVGKIFASAAIAAQSNLIVAHKGDLLRTFDTSRSNYLSSSLSSVGEVTGTLLYQTRLSPPFNDLELIFAAENLPVSGGRAFITWTAAVLVGVLFGGFWGMYRMGLKQITLNNQQQDFVSAISHELKTPLTSIRMYGEILKAGWASEEKKRSYYDFIFTESERLSRLINNVLQLARLTRNTTDIKLKPISVRQLVDAVHSKISSQIEQARFELIEDHQDPSAMLLADTDAFAQVMINLVDNAIKFSANSDTRRIEIKSRVAQDDSIEFSIRDHGPGVPKDQMRRIFEMFYRTERELTRETVGTGIGLALVHELVSAMRGTIKARNMEPGVEFRLQFPGYDDAHT